jgi:colanic acid/amylovoran biosynthesis glycosyltransferase
MPTSTEAMNKGDRETKAVSRVCHIINEYLGHTLNWVYTQIKYATQIEHYVLASKTQNLEQYPVEHLFSPKRLSISRIPMVERVSRRLGWYPPEYLACFYRAMRQYPPSLIHAHFGWDGFFVLPLARWMKTPLMTRFYGYDIGSLPRIPLWRRRYKTLFRQGDWFLVEGEYMKKSLVALGCPGEKVIVHRLGIELDRIQFRRRTYTSGAFHVLMAASFVEKKGLCYGLQAIARVISKTGTDIQVSVIGDGPLRGELEQLARDLGIAQRISWLGRQSHERFMQLLNEAHVFLSPSVTASDGNTEGGAPVTLAEASAAGLPVISSFHADIPAVILDGQTGFLAGERDVEGLSAALEKFVTCPKLVLEFGENGRRFVEREHDVVVQGAQLTDIYEHVVEEWRSRR